MCRSQATIDTTPRMWQKDNVATSLNIYFLDLDPALSAQALTDDHVRRAPGLAATVLRDAAAMRRAVHEGRSVRRGEAEHPRHPITRAAARSDKYAAWVYDHGRAAATDVVWRSLGEPARDCLVGQHLWAELAELAAVDPVRRRYVPVDDLNWLDAVPQRLDGCEDFAVPGDPVAAYRRFYATAKLPGGARAWAGTQAVWTRRTPPAWLAEHDAYPEELTCPGDPWPVWGAFVRKENATS